MQHIPKTLLLVLFPTEASVIEFIDTLDNSAWLYNIDIEDEEAFINLLSGELALKIQEESHTIPPPVLRQLMEGLNLKESSYIMLSILLLVDSEQKKRTKEYFPH